jgi:hypothetical protein
VWALETGFRWGRQGGRTAVRPYGGPRAYGRVEGEGNGLGACARCAVGGRETGFGGQGASGSCRSDCGGGG